MFNWLNNKTNPHNLLFYVSNHYFDNKNGLSSSASQEIKEKIGQAKHCPPVSQEWINSVYSYNKTFTKALPMTDNIVNRLIKSYFSLTPLFKGKKSKRVQIRFRRLSLNKVLVSKAEMKHTNNKVIITVYLYNKNKKFLIYKLKNLYKTFLLKMPNIIKNKINKNPKTKGLANKSKFNLKRVISVAGAQKPTYNTYVSGKSMMKNPKIAKNNFFNAKSKYSKLNKINSTSKLSTSNKKLITKRFKNSSTKENNITKVYNYINNINLTNKKLSKFFVKLKNSNLKNKYKTLMKKYYYIFNKYKLYSLNYNKNYFLSFDNLSLNTKNNLYTSKFYNILKGNIDVHFPNSTNTSGFNTKRKIKKSKFKKFGQNKNIKTLMHKIRSFYKLFLLDNLYKFNTINSVGIRSEKTSVLNNIYKLVKKSIFSKSKKRINNISLKAVSIIKKARKRKNFILRALKWNNENFTNYEYKYYQNFLKKAYKKEILYTDFGKL